MYKCMVCILFLLQNFYILTGALQCMGEHNETVDWFMIYKIPKTKSGGPLIKDGVGYTYISSTTNKKWQFSELSINDSISILGNTLNPFYKNHTDIAYALYNDQPPNQPSKATKGHTKGVILADVNGGFWLIHSVPFFPQLGPNYNYPKTGLLKGQSFLCISLDLKNLDKVGIQLQYNQPQIYHSYISQVLKTKIKEIENAVSGIVVTKPPWYNKITINSKNGVTFTSFAKSRQFGKELYKDWVAPALATDLWVETWSLGVGKLPSNCSLPFKVYNVQSVSLAVAQTRFSSTQDHSKWAVSLNSSWICIGDINRMEHQKMRGGGTVCLNDPTLSGDYRDSVVAIEKCHNSLN